MSLQQPGPQDQTLYQVDATTAHTMRSIQDHIHKVCQGYVNRLVRVETMDGEVFEGVLSHCDQGIIYLRMPQTDNMRGFFPNPYNNLVLPLVLYNLLVITLLV